MHHGIGHMVTGGRGEVDITSPPWTGHPHTPGQDTPPPQEGEAIDLPGDFGGNHTDG